MKKTVFLTSLTTALCSGAVIAGTMGTPMSEPWRKVLAISAGPAWNETYDMQRLVLQPEIEKAYTSANNNDILAATEVFLGIQHVLNPMFIAQLGLAVAATGNAKISGEIWDDAEPEFNNFAYSYRVNHTAIAVKGKLLAEMGYAVSPYVSASLGVGFNRAHGFKNQPLIFEAIVNPDFASHTETAFSYTIGAGLQRAVTENVHVGVGYEFADWGKNQLGLAPGQTLGHGLIHDHLYTNGLMFNLTYIA